MHATSIDRESSENFDQVSLCFFSNKMGSGGTFFWDFSALIDCLVLPLQEKLDDWRRSVTTMDKDHARGKTDLFVAGMRGCGGS